MHVCMCVLQVGLECEVEVDPGDGTPVTCTEQSLNNTVYSGVLDLLITVRSAV